MFYRSMLLNTRPVKQIPNILIYNTPHTPIYKMITTFMPRTVGEMIAYPKTKNKKKFLWIQHLLIFQKRSGFGTRFLNFAKNLSSEMGCNGDIRLKAAATIYDSITPPHEFYRKAGFGSDNRKILRRIDWVIKHNIHLNPELAPAIEMYYPDNKNKHCFFQKLIHLFKKQK